jgi:hypothetical protein
MEARKREEREERKRGERREKREERREEREKKKRNEKVWGGLVMMGKGLKEWADVGRPQWGL